TLMPVWAVNSEGVSFAMSFICGLSTIATLIAPPPFVAGDPPDDELLEPPPQPTTTTATTAHNAATDPRRRVPRMGISPPALDAESQLLPHTNATYNVGLCWLSSDNSPIRRYDHACSLRIPVFRCMA